MSTLFVIKSTQNFKVLGCLNCLQLAGTHFTLRLCLAVVHWSAIKASHDCASAFVFFEMLLVSSDCYTYISFSTRLTL